MYKNALRLEMPVGEIPQSFRLVIDSKERNAITSAVGVRSAHPYLLVLSEDAETFGVYGAETIKNEGVATLVYAAPELRDYLPAVNELHPGILSAMKRGEILQTKTGNLWLTDLFPIRTYRYVDLSGNFGFSFILSEDGRYILLDRDGDGNTVLYFSDGLGGVESPAYFSLLSAAVEYAEGKGL